MMMMMIWGTIETGPEQGAGGTQRRSAEWVGFGAQ